jgi:hypothetical protein
MELSAYSKNKHFRYLMFFTLELNFHNKKLAEILLQAGFRSIPLHAG